MIFSGDSHWEISWWLCYWCQQQSRVKFLLRLFESKQQRAYCSLGFSADNGRDSSAFTGLSAFNTIVGSVLLQYIKRQKLSMLIQCSSSEVICAEKSASLLILACVRQVDLNNTRAPNEHLGFLFLSRRPSKWHRNAACNTAERHDSILTTWLLKWNENQCVYAWRETVIQTGKKQWIFSLVRRCACGCSGRVHCLEKIVKTFIYFFLSSTGSEPFSPETQKRCGKGQWLDAPRQNLLFFVGFSIPPFTLWLTEKRL